MPFVLNIYLADLLTGPDVIVHASLFSIIHRIVIGAPTFLKQTQERAKRTSRSQHCS